MVLQLDFASGKWRNNMFYNNSKYPFIFFTRSCETVHNICVIIYWYLILLILHSQCVVNFKFGIKYKIYNCQHDSKASNCVTPQYDAFYI